MSAARVDVSIRRASAVDRNRSGRVTGISAMHGVDQFPH
jgi:hypothetical protein